MGVFNEVTTPGSCVNNFVITRTWIFIDACGNQSQEVQTITVNDDTDPVVSCPANQSGFQCGDVIPAAAASIADFLALGGTVSDNCTAQGDITISSNEVLAMTSTWRPAATHTSSTTNATRRSTIAGSKLPPNGTQLRVGGIVRENQTLLRLSGTPRP